MHRRLLKVREAFPKSADAQAEHVMRLLQYRKEETNVAWEELEEKWRNHNERMVKSGLRPRNEEECMIKLNVGGSNVSVLWQSLADTKGFEDSSLGALLEGVWDKGWIPVDADGRIVIDESPEGIHHIIHTILTGRSSSGAAGLPDSAAHSAVAFDEVPCFIYTAHVMGLPGYAPTHPRYLKIDGGSTILEPFEIAPLGSKIREWVGGSTEHMTLIYRATRDGFDTKSFKPACNEDTTSHVISLIRVSSGEGSDDDDSVVGGYSVLAWGKGVKSEQTIAKETFVFMLKDGSATGKDPSKPVKWNPNPKHVGFTFGMMKNVGARVALGDLWTLLDETSGGCTILTGRGTFDIEEDSPFLALTRKKVVDIEVYRCSIQAPPTATPPSTTAPGGDELADAEADDSLLFGKSIATSLMEERVVLDRAVKEMEAGGARVIAAVGALEAVYGPSVAAGEPDAVVDLNVRGTRITTLRSTLQACPCSTLATMFDAERWPATDKDNDNLGRRLIDCNPTCFSKILDVLRMRKRISWSRGVKWVKRQQEKEVKEEDEEEQQQEEHEEEEGSIGRLGAILVKAADVEIFSEAVNMYFPGCESFIIDMVQSV